MKINLIIAVVALIWVGMILAIGMESVVKFNTPTLTKPIGFDVGRTVFAAFNKAQLGLLIIIIISLLFSYLTFVDKSLIAFITLILVLQIFWLFPALSQRVDLILSGIKPAPTYMHGFYGALEIAKLILLFILGLRLAITS